MEAFLLRLQLEEQQKLDQCLHFLIQGHLLIFMLLEHLIHK